MKNILKGQLRMLPRHTMSHLVFIGVLLLQVMTTYFNINAVSELITNAGVMAALNNTIYALTTLIFLFIFIAQISLSDFSDKTSYYEIMGGHTRLEVYFGRVIPSVVIGTVGTFVLMIVPDITATILLGWGNEIPVGEIIIRRLLLIFPIIRIGCEFACICFLFKKLYAALIAGFLMFMFGGEIATTNTSPWLGVTSIAKLYEVDIWTTYGLDSEIHFSYEASLQAETVVPVIIVSIIAAAISLVIGYQFFKADDMN